MSHDMPHAARTDVGRRRDHNEDALVAQPPLIAVADGVGGSAKGEVASRLALDALIAAAPEVSSVRVTSEAVAAMERAVLAANQAVHDAQLRDESLRGMATTITAAVARDGGEVIVGHVGDSRLYVLSAAGTRLVTEDHSVVAELVRTGRLDPAEATHHPQRNVITRALGPEPDVTVDAFSLHVGPGDWLLVCSDGLTEHVADAELAQLLLDRSDDPEGAVLEFVRLANERGGTDNISVAVAQPIPSDVSGELDLETLQAGLAATTSIPIPQPSDAPAERSGPLRAIAPPEGARDVETSGELPQLQPISHDEPVGARPRRSRSRLRARSWVLLGLVALLTAAAVVFTWSQSYFLMERADGRVGINRGFPVARMATPYRASDVVAAELSPADREDLVESHRILSREDAERVLAELPERVAEASGEELDDIAART